MKPNIVSRGSVLTLLLIAAAGAAAGCSSSEKVGGTTGSGGSKSPGTGGSTSTTGSGGSTSTTGAGGSVSTTGAGGSVSTTGAGGAGGSVSTTGAGGTGVVQKDCATKTTPMNPVLLNFENYDGTVAPSMYGTAYGGAAANMGTVYTGPFVYPEADMGTPPTLAILAGRPPSQWAVSATWSATMWGMGGGMWMGCANATAYKGISLWVRGTGSALNVFNFSVSMESTSMPNAQNPAGGGTCPGAKPDCVPPTASDIPLTADWTQVSIYWTEQLRGTNPGYFFAPGKSGATTAVVPNGDNINGLGWSVPLQYVLAPGATDPVAGPYVPVPATLVINIDDVQFIP